MKHDELLEFASSLGHFDDAEYYRQLERGVQEP
jgi:hypothetical protein